jgi:hypothetical protein
VVDTAPLFLMTKRRTCVIDGRLRKESIELRASYRLYNKEYFSNKLPRNMFLFWEDKPSIGKHMYLGRFYEVGRCSEWQRFPVIAVASHLRAHVLYPSTLLHEMIHASGRLGHSGRFDRERRRLLRYKAVREMAL